MVPGSSSEKTKQKKESKMAKSIFDDMDIDKAEYTPTSKYVTPGLHLVEIQKVKEGVTRKKRPFFVVEMKVLESSNEKEHPIGTPMSWMVMCDQDAAAGNIKHFLGVAADKDIKAVTNEDAAESVSEENPFGGMKIRVMAVNIKTQSGNDSTKVTFMSADTSSADAQKALSSAQVAAA
jgi:hypothetical protein